MAPLVRAVKVGWNRQMDRAAGGTRGDARRPCNAGASQGPNRWVLAADRWGGDLRYVGSWRHAQAEHPDERQLTLAVRNTVREMRSARGLSQGQLGEALHVSRQTINAIETERYTPSLPLALELARFFGTTVEDMFDVDEPRTHE